jgi:hypothetical protein
MREKTIRVGG